MQGGVEDDNGISGRVLSFCCWCGNVMTILLFFGVVKRCAYDDGTRPDFEGSG